MKKNIIAVSFLLLLTFSILACAKKENTQVADANVETSVEGTTANAINGIPNIVCETNKGTTFDLSKTTKPVLVNFWATW